MSLDYADQVTITHTLEREWLKANWHYTDEEIDTPST